MQGKEFGQHLKQLRLNRGWTKEQLCGDESKLSIRQLTRLESGISQPTLSTLEYLAFCLEVDLTTLTGSKKEDVALPTDYQRLKYKLIRTTTYGNTEALFELEHIIDEIFEVYYDDLPEAEQNVMDILQSKIYTYTSEKFHKYGMTLFAQHLDDLQSKKHYDVNDLLYIQLYQIYVGDEEEIRSAKFDKELYARIAQRLLQSVDYIPNEYLFLMRDALLTIPGIECERKEFIYTKDTLNKLNVIMELTEDYQKKPLIRMLEGEYELFVHKDEKKAQQYYEEGLTLARLLGHTFLSKKMAEEWNKEFRLYHQG